MNHDINQNSSNHKQLIKHLRRFKRITSLDRVRNNLVKGKFQIESILQSVEKKTTQHVRQLNRMSTSRLSAQKKEMEMEGDIR